jgi:hypothetical protein
MATVASLRRLSSLLFGNADRIEVALYIASADNRTISAPDLAENLMMPPNRVRAQLLLFAHLGMLDPMPRTDGRAYYMRRNDDFWTSFDALCKQLLAVAARPASAQD